MGGVGAPDDLDKGHRTQVWLATSDEPAATVSGRFFFHQKLRDPDPATKDVDRRVCSWTCVGRFQVRLFPKLSLHLDPIR